jgi:hypothetical protein
MYSPSLQLAYRERYFAAVAAAKERAPTPAELSGAEAIKKVLSSNFVDDNLSVNPDPLDLQEGQIVEMFPVDTGFNAKDSGKLIGLGKDEAVIETRTREGEKEIR